jgi:outer membrane lipoprotein-sorting protein
MMNNLKYLVFALLLLSINTFASDADKLLKEVKDKFNSIKDFSAQINQDGKNSVFNGTVMFKKENKFRLELKNMTIISDGTTLWNYSKKENKVVIDEVNEESFPFSLEILLNEYPSKSNLSSSTEGKFRILELTPKPGSRLNFTRARLWINEQNLVERINVENQQSGYSFRLSGYKLNQDTPDSMFSFKAPEGSRVIDLR